MTKPAAPLSKPRTPGIRQQKAFITANSDIIGAQIGRAILEIVIMEAGRAPIMVSTDPRETNINLDHADISDELIALIYNKVKACRAELDRPAS